MVEMSVYFIAFLCAFAIFGIFSFIEDVVDYINKGKWYVGVICIVLLVIVYFLFLWRFLNV